jgi:hypothetical protein
MSSALLELRNYVAAPAAAEFTAFADSLTSDTGFAVRRTLVMRGIEAIDPDDPGAKLRRLVKRSATHRSQADYCDVGDSCHSRNDAICPKISASPCTP